jgi:hypothetical protein
MVAMKYTSVITFFRISFFLGAMLISLYPLPIAATEIKAHYTSPHGKEIILTLIVGNPPPSTLIVVQKVPPGTEIVRSVPVYKSYRAKDGEIKWLIKKPAIGNLSIQLHLKSPLRAGSVSAMVRYLDANNGTFKTEVVK